MEKTTYQMIADELGISVATISNVVHGKKGKLSRETSRKVWAALEKHGYFPQSAQVLLGQNPCRMAGLVIHDHPQYKGHPLQDPYISTMVSHLEREAAKAGMQLVLHITDDWETIHPFSTMWNLTGLVVAGFCDADYDRLRPLMRIPLVVYDGFGLHHPDICNLCVDDFEGGRQAGIAFKERGHEKVLFLSNNFVCNAGQRYAGLQDVIDADGLQLPMDPDVLEDWLEKNLETMSSYSGLFCASDVYAARVQSFLLKRGLRKAIIGFDGLDFGQWMHPSLATICQDHGLRASMAMEHITRGRPSAKVPVSFRKGESVCPAGS